MKIFVVNCGSSSIKYQLISMTNETVLARGVMERVGSNDAVLTHQTNGEKYERHVAAPNHSEGMKAILSTLVDSQMGVISNVSEIQCVGHRVVHGGEKITHPCLIDNDIIAIIKENFQLAPLHNPANLTGIEAAMEAMPDKPQVAVFDTAFLSTMPPTSYRYAVPGEWYRKYRVRKYGFHGTSHRYVAGKSAELLGKTTEQTNLITVHMGNGCSITVTQNGKAFDHSMGLTPLEGLMMGTRCGDLDPAVVYYMYTQGLSPEEIDNVLNKQSGLMGVSELCNDMRDLLDAADDGNEKARLAVEMFVYRVVKYIGSYLAAVADIDAIVFTGGIGENSKPIRKAICRRLEHLGIKFDEAKNEKIVGGKTGLLTAEDSKLQVWVVPTNEELMIARSAKELTQK